MTQDERSLFDVGEDQAIVLSAEVTPRSEWREVPQARFLSWSSVMQSAYCRACDLDSAAHAENDAWRVFYVRRAEMYAA